MIAKQPYKFVKDASYISHTSINDFVRCPRSYYLKNIYRNPETKFKLQIASPYITLGATVHDLLDWYIKTPNKPQTKEEFFDMFRQFWRKFQGKKGGFTSREEEATFGKRGLAMVENFLNNAKVLEKAAPSLKFPKYELIDKVMLIGNFDYVGLMEDGSLHIIDFKTGAKDEESPIQLYIYAILAESNYQRLVSKVSYWYLDRADAPQEVVLDPLDATLEWLTRKAKDIKAAIQKDDWVCVKPGLCRECKEYLALIAGYGDLMFSDTAFKKDVYFLDRTKLVDLDYTLIDLQKPKAEVEITDDLTFALQSGIKVEDGLGATVLEKSSEIN